MKVLVACEESQEVCKAFRSKGHNAYSCDIQEPSGGHPEWHILGDAVQAMRGGRIVTMDGKFHNIEKWDLLIAHPPCTYLSNAGARHLWKDHQLNADRVTLGIHGRDLFMRFWWADSDNGWGTIEGCAAFFHRILIAWRDFKLESPELAMVATFWIE